MVLFQKKSILYPVLSSIKKKYPRRKSNLLPLASTLLLHTLPATNRPAVIYRTGVNYETLISNTRTLITRRDIKG